VDLGTPGGIFSLATGVTNKGQAVGFGDNGIPDRFSEQFSGFGTGTQMRAFLWQNGVMQDLGTLGGPDAMAVSVNERGQVAGNSFTNWTADPDTGTPIVHPFLWECGRMIDLGGFGGSYGFTNAINKRGQVIGLSSLQGNPSFHPFLWNGRTMKDLGTLGGTYGNATSINDAGEIVGWATPEGDQVVHAFLWRDGAMTDLGLLSGDSCSLAQGVNSRGQVIGVSTDCGPVEHPFVWQNGGPMVDLNKAVLPGSNVTVKDVFFINDRGEIAGYGNLPNGDRRAVLLIPCEGNRDGKPTRGRGCESDGENAIANTTETSTTGIQGRVTPEMLDALRNQSGRYGGAGARPHR
jgi:probable HAF family extracellular repeat protein